MPGHVAHRIEVSLRDVLKDVCAELCRIAAPVIVRNLIFSIHSVTVNSSRGHAQCKIGEVDKDCPCFEVEVVKTTEGARLLGVLDLLFCRCEAYPSRLRSDLEPFPRQLSHLHLGLCQLPSPPRVHSL